MNIKKLKESVDVLKLLIHYQFEKITDEGDWIATLCPYHTDSNPSFAIRKSDTKFHCWSCKASGDAIQLVMDLENVDFKLALTKLSGITGYVIDENSCMEYLKKEWLESKTIIKEASEATLEKNIQIQKLHNFITKFAILKFKNSAAEAYLKERGFSSEVVKKYGLGYIPNKSLLDFAKNWGFTEAEIHACGYDVPRFNNRLVFPIFNLEKNVVAISGRALDNETKPKYTATPNSSYYKKGLFLYGLKDVVKGAPITLVEGNLDYIRLHSLGVNALAQLGSALTKMQCLLLKSLTNEVVLMYDGDEAGRKALMVNILPLVEQGLMVLVVLLPEGSDPDTFFKQGMLLYEREYGLKYYLNNLNNDLIMNCLKSICKITAKTIKDSYIRQLSSFSGLSTLSINAELRLLSK